MVTFLKMPNIKRLKNHQGFIEGRIEEIEGVLSRAEVIDPKTLSGDTVRFSATVQLVDEEDDQEHTYQIVGQSEADIKNGFISFDSPLGKALIGKTKGDNIQVRTPGGQRTYEVLNVEYK